MSTLSMIGTPAAVIGLAYLAGFIKFWSLCAEAPADPESFDA